MTTVEREGLAINQTNYDGFVFNESFGVRHGSCGGWVIYANNGVKYGRDAKGHGLYAMEVAHPITGYRVRRYRNAWRTKREAERALAYLLNAGTLVRASV